MPWSAPLRRALAWLALWLASAFLAAAAEVLPPKPPNHFNDFAGIVRSETAARLNRELAQFERDQSTQIVVAIYPRLPPNSAVDDYAVRLAQKWGVGQKGRDNGAALFAFQESHDLRIVTGYGVEGALPDALAKQIIENEIAPRFRAGDFDGGLTAGVQAMMAAVRGEYTGTGRTAAQSGARPGGRGGGMLLPIIIAMIVIGLLRRGSRRNVAFGRGGRRSTWLGGGPWGGGGLGGGGWGGGSWGGGGGSSGGGTFSGGGGSFGGGGAGGKW